MGVKRAIVVVAALTAACTLTTSLDGLTGGLGDAGPSDTDGADVVVRPDDATTEALADVTAPPLPVTVVVNGGIANATGRAQQTHLLYAARSKTWVLFYVTGVAPTTVATRLSRDLVTWTDGASLALPIALPPDGRSFSATYADLGADVFHLSLSMKKSSSERRHFHARATLSGDALAFGAPAEVGSTTATDGTLDPDGPSVAVIAGGRVLETSGWWGADGGPSRVGNMIAWRSTFPDDGGAWSPSFGPAVEVEVVAAVANARIVLPHGSGALALWEGAEADPNPSDVRSARFDGTDWQPATSTGYAKNPFDPNDWGVARADDGTVHVVRNAGIYEHRVFDGLTWTSGVVMPTSSHATGGGVVVLAADGAVRTYALDPAGAIRTTTLAAGAWSPWVEVLPAAAGRSSLTGHAAGGAIVLAWTEARGASQDIVALRVR